MQLFVSPTSPYARKARIVARELGLDLNEVEASPLDDPPALRTANPLGKVPALVLDDGRVLADSKLITDYLDSLGGGRFHPAGEARWEALRRAMLAEGVIDAALGIVFERRRPAAQQSPMWLDRWARAIHGGLAELARATGGEAGRFDIGDVGLVVALEYLDFRLADLGWRERQPGLVAWHARHCDRPSIVATRPA